MRNVRFWGGIGLVVMLLVAGLLLTTPGRHVLAQESLTPGTPIEGTITSDDGNSYALTVSAGQLLMISMESDDLDSYIVLADTAGNELLTADYGGDGDDALLVYVAQQDATYTVIAKPYWSGSGAFTLTANLIDPVLVELGGTATLTAAAEEEVVYAVFAAPANTVVNIQATDQNTDEDIRIELFGTDGQSIETDDDDGPGYNPLLRRVVLPTEGLYLIQAETVWSDTPLTAPVDIQIEVTEQLFITAEPYTVTLNDDELGTEVFTFEAVSDTVYRITVTAANGTGVQMELLDTNAFFEPDFETGSAVKATWEYLSDVNGLVRIDVHPSFFSDGDDLTFTIETVQ